MLERTRLVYDCAFVDDDYAVGTIINGTEVIGKVGDIARLFGEYQKLVVVIGNNTLREKVYKDSAAIGYDFPNIIVSSAYNGPYATIGSDCIISNNAVV